MALLTKAEVREETVKLLSLLAQSPAWVLYAAHLRKLSRSNAAVKAEALRSGDERRAIYLQGIEDGLERAQRLDQYVRDVDKGVVTPPPLSGEVPLLGGEDAQMVV